MVLRLGVAADRLSLVARHGSSEALAVEGLTPDLTRVLERELHEHGGAMLTDVNGARAVLFAPLMVMADLPATYREAYRELVRAPMLVVNVALKNWRSLYDAGITAASYRDQFGFSCNLRQSMIAGDYHPPLHPDKPTVLTFYVSFSKPGMPLREQTVTARNELLATSYREYERRIREQLVRLFGGLGFDPRRDIAGIVLNRWGHAYVCPSPGFYFGRDGKPAAPDVIRQPVGRVGFANSELHGHQNWVDAVAEGRRAAEQAGGRAATG